jgi:TrmH family RNA methyltransferase
MKNITSLTHSFIKEIVKLRDNAAARKSTGLCIVEGQRALSTFLDSGITLTTLVWSDTYEPEIPSVGTQVTKYMVSEEVMKKISSLQTPSGILAVAKIPTPKAEITDGILLDNLQDPGNAGMLIRTAAACNQTAILKLGGVDLWSPKVVQASAGAVALVSIHTIGVHDLHRIKKSKKLLALVPRDGNPADTSDLSNSILIIGNEGKGISPELLTLSDDQITLSMPGNTESLNAAAAGSIALYVKYLNTRK